MAAPVVEYDEDVEADKADVEMTDEERSIKEEEHVEEAAKSNAKLWLAAKLLCLVGLVAFTIAAFVHDSEEAVVLIYWWIAIGVIAVSWLLTHRFTAPYNAAGNALNSLSETIVNSRPLSIGLGVVGSAIIIIIIALSIDGPDRLMALVGIVVLLFFSWAVSYHRTKVALRPVIGGLLLQFLFALFILRTTPGFQLFNFLGEQVNAFLAYVNKGAIFVFGGLATGDGNEDLFLDFGVFAFSVVPVVIFFSAFTSVMYYLGIMQTIIRVIGKTLAYFLGTSASESLNAAGNIFVGQTEAPLLIRPFMKDMTASEIHAVMTGGFATIAGSVLASFIREGVPASHLLTASVMSAPAALAVSKIVYPEVEVSKTRAGINYEIPTGDHPNLIAAAAAGAADAIVLAANIVAQLIAFVSAIAMLDAWLAYFGLFIGAKLTFTKVAGWAFYPIAFLMGVPAEDCEIVGQLFGTKVFINEFAAYLDLAKIKRRALEDGIEDISARSFVIATYGLCGFANFASMGIQIGGLTPLAPNKGKLITKLVFSAMIAGNVACFLTGCIASLLLTDEASTFTAI